MAASAVIRRIAGSVLFELLVDGEQTGDTSASMQTLGQIAKDQYDVPEDNITVEVSPEP